MKPGFLHGSNAQIFIEYPAATHMLKLADELDIITDNASNDVMGRCIQADVTCLLDIIGICIRK
jgi:hypothetical protein